MHRNALLLSCLSATLLAGCAIAPARREAHSTISVDVPQVKHPQGETPAWWYRSGAARAAGNGAMKGRAKNVILFLGDGMSLTTVAAARILEGQRKGNPGEENQLSWEGFPHTALSKTYNTDSQTPDSAGTMTAIATGVKSHMGGIAVGAGDRSDCAGSLGRQLLTWLELADSAGLATGIVSTARLTHATPAATYAHAPERKWENDADVPPVARAEGCTDIAQQLVAPSRFGRGPTVALGGGRREFTSTQQRDPEYDDKVGQRLDGRDLPGEWLRAHPQGAYVWNARQLREAQGAPALLGLFEADHMQFNHDRDRGPEGDPSLTELTLAAISTLSKNPRGFVLMVEGGRIDHANHDSNAFRALDETIALSDAVRAAANATSAEDTLIIVTADHSHTLNLVGYPVRGNPILGKVRGRGDEEDLAGGLARDLTGQVFTTLVYANGPGNTGASNQQPEGPKRYLHSPSRYEARTGRPDLGDVDTADPDYLQESLVPLSDESHGGDDVGIWATGPGSEAVRGTVEQNAIYHFIVQATPKLRQRLCAAGTCDARGVPVELPKPADFESAAAKRLEQ